MMVKYSNAEKSYLGHWVLIWPPRGVSNEYVQHRCLWRNKKSTNNLKKNVLAEALQIHRNI